MEKLLLPAMLTLTIMLAIMYISKKNKNKLIAALFAIFGFAGMSLLILALYDEFIIRGQNDWWRLMALSGILIAMVVGETFEILGLIPDKRNL